MSNNVHAGKLKLAQITNDGIHFPSVPGLIHAHSIGTTSPKGALRTSVEAQITGYGGTSLGNAPHRSVKNTSVCGTIPRSSSHAKHGRDSKDKLAVNSVFQAELGCGCLIALGGNHYSEQNSDAGAYRGLQGTFPLLPRESHRSVHAWGDNVREGRLSATVRVASYRPVAAFTTSGPSEAPLIGVNTVSQNEADLQRLSGKLHVSYEKPKIAALWSLVHLENSPQ